MRQVNRLAIGSSHPFHTQYFCPSPKFLGYFYFRWVLPELEKQSGLAMFCLAASSSFVLALRILCPATESDGGGF